MKEKNLFICLDGIEIDKEKLKETCAKASILYQQRCLKKGATMYEVWKLQLHLIRPWLWLTQIALLILFGGFLLLMKTTENYEKASLLLTMFPVCMALLHMLELTKSMNCGMYEIECGTRYDVRSILWLRMLMMGISDVLVFSVLLCLCTLTLAYPIYLILVYLLVPFTSSLCIAFALWLLQSYKTISLQLIGFLLGYGVCFSVLVYSYQLYEQFSQQLWICLLMVMMITLCIECFIVIKGLRKGSFQVRQTGGIGWN